MPEPPLASSSSAGNYPGTESPPNSNRTFRCQALSDQFCHTYGFAGFQPVLSDKSGSTGFRLTAFFRTLFGSSRLLALCNVIGLRQGKIKTSFISQIQQPQGSSTTLPASTSTSAGDVPTDDSKQGLFS